MVRDYFQDIIPNGHDDSDPSSDTIDVPSEYENAAPARSIRNISAPSRSRRPSIAGGSGGVSARPVRRRTITSMAMWIVAGAAVLVLVGLGLFALRATTITVTPRSDTITFDKTAQFIAYPVATAASGTLAYSVSQFDVQDSETLATQGTMHGEHKASGTITVYNNYSATPLKLIKNTRFQTDAGLVFRTPNDIVVPAKSASAPGQVNVTVIADKSGSSYNIEAGAALKVPGLASNKKEYATVYARTVSTMAGGFSGDEPAVAPADQAAAISNIRTRLGAKINAAVAAYASATTTALAGLARVTYSDTTSPQGDGKSVSLTETAHVEIPVFASGDFAHFVAQSTITDIDSAGIKFIPSADFGAVNTDAASSTLGSGALAFSLSGTAELLWNIDTQAFIAAIAGRDGGAFTTIVTGFPAIAEAHARIEPFWKTEFPKDPTSIKVVITEPHKKVQ